jgi:hypothetical protein
MVCKNKELSRYVRNFGGPLSFSAQLEPPCVGAAVASAKIHLSDEIYSMQAEIANKISYCNTLLKKANIPLLEENQCPVFYIPTGLPSSGYNMSKRLMGDGFYVNMGIFPAVPVKNTGIRFTISRHNQIEEIEQLVDAIKYHYPRMLEQENRTENDVRKSFKLPEIKEQAVETVKSNLVDGFAVVHKTSIEEIDAEEWNALFGYNGVFDWGGLKSLQTAFSANDKPEGNWDFHYIIIKDKTGKVVTATFFTVGLFKDDMMAPASISKQIEEERVKNPYYLTSKVVSMGSLVTEGEHLYLNKENTDWKSAIKLLFNIMTEEQDKAGATMIMLRDFEDTDAELKELFTGQGFVKIAMPETCIVEDMNWTTTEEFISTLSARSRRHFRNDVLKFESAFNVEIKDSATEEELAQYIQLFKNVKSRNFDINTFDYPVKFFETMSKTKDWEFIVLKQNQAAGEVKIEEPLAVIFCYKNASNNYNPIFVGVNYDHIDKYNTYRQAIFQVIKRAKALGSEKVFLGLSATIEKKKFGALIIPKVAYVQAKDNFNMEFIETMAVKSTN